MTSVHLTLTSFPMFMSFDLSSEIEINSTFMTVISLIRRSQFDSESNCTITDSKYF